MGITKVRNSNLQALMAQNIAKKAAGFTLGFALIAGMGMPAHAQSTNAQIQAQIQALLAQIASLQAQLGTGGVLGTTTTKCTFTRDLTVGSQGADVTCLQTYLTSTGHYSFSGGATGYFGPVTQAAVARWQAANGITPAAGYFGPISRAKYAAVVVTPTTPTTPDDDDDDDNDNGGALEGGEGFLNVEGNLRDVESTVEEDEEDVNVLGVELEAEDSDMMIERVDVEFALGAGGSNNLDDYISEVALMLDGEELDRQDVDEGDEDDDIYSFRFSGLDGIIREGDMGELYVVVSAVGNVDSDDTDVNITVDIEADGIRAVDAEGLSETYGTEGNIDAETFRVIEAVPGELTIRESDEDPNTSILVADADETSDEFTVFVFELENDDEEDVMVNDLTIDVATTSASGSGAADIRDIIDTATLVVDGEEFDGDINANTIVFEDMDLTVDEDDTVTVELMIELLGQSGNFAATGEGLTFSIDDGDIDAEGVDTGEDADIEGSATGASHTIGLTGISVMAEGDSVNSEAEEGYATYTIEFSVTAEEDDAYIYNGAASTSVGATVGVVYDITGTNWPGGTESAVITSSADMSGNYWVVDEGDTETFTLTVTLDPDASGTFALELEAIGFNNTAATADTTYNIDQNNQEFETNAVFIPGS